MAENREEILADFQACTGIEDIAEAIYILDENNWDLVRSVNHMMPPESQAFRASSGPDVEMVSEVIDVPASPVETATDTMSLGNNEGFSKPSRSMPILDAHLNSPEQQPSTSSLNNEAPKVLRFNVQYNDRVFPIDVSDNETLADIKIRIHNEFKVPPCRQLLSGWARMANYENTPLKKLSLPTENAVLLTVKSSSEGVSMEEDNEVTEHLNGSYILKITDVTNNKTYSLPFAGTKTILEVKSDVYTIINIAVRNQLWTGWPPNIDDRTVLALSGIDFPEHELKVQQSASLVREKRQNNTGVVQIDSDDDEFEDASETFSMDDYFVDNESSSKRIEPLIPEHIEDDIVGSINFAEQFTLRYGPTHPSFYEGTLDDAMKEACSKPAKDRKVLGIYLHHDSSVLSNVFCTQLLGSESVIQLMESNFVLWGWDVTFQSNRTRLQHAIMGSLGHKATSSLWNIPANKLPAIIIIMKNRSNIIIYTVIYGNVGVNELLSRLVEVVEVFTDNQRVEVQEEQDRAERELVKWEQDMAYRESLEADRAKEEAKRQQAEAESNEKKRVETETAIKKERRESHRKEVEAGLPSEPSHDQGDITKIRFRLPRGDNLERRFYVSTPLKVLLDYLIVQGYPTEEYKVISSWPRQDLTALDSGTTLQELKLCPQETVILEER